jgi:ribosomal protein uL22
MAGRARRASPAARAASAAAQRGVASNAAATAVRHFMAARLPTSRSGAVTPGLPHAVSSCLAHQACPSRAPLNLAPTPHLVAPAAAKSKGSHVRVHFKNAVEVAAAIRGLELERAKTYLQHVLEEKEAIPFNRFKGGRGRHAQAKNLKVPGSLVGWPKNAVKAIQSLLLNAEANAESKGLETGEQRRSESAAAATARERAAAVVFPSGGDRLRRRQQQQQQQQQPLRRRLVHLGGAPSRLPCQAPSAAQQQLVEAADAAAPARTVTAQVVLWPGRSPRPAPPLPPFPHRTPFRARREAVRDARGGQGGAQGPPPHVPRARPH